MGGTWWLIPLSKWVITPVINGISRVNPFITGVISHLLSGMSHQVSTIKNHQNMGGFDTGLPFLNLQVATLVGNVYIYLWSMESMDCLGEQLSNTIKGGSSLGAQLGSRTWSPSCQPRWYSASRTRLNFDLPAELGCEAEIGSNWGLNYLGVGWASNNEFDLM